MQSATDSESPLQTVTGVGNSVGCLAFGWEGNNFSGHGPDSTAVHRTTPDQAYKTDASSPACASRRLEAQSASASAARSASETKTSSCTIGTCAALLFSIGWDGRFIDFGLQ